MNTAAAIQELHDRCAVYTSAPVAARMLDAIGWSSDADLANSVLLEPCAGDGAILVEGVQRLVASLCRAGLPLTRHSLLPRIRSFELHPGAAASARSNLCLALADAGIARPLAIELAKAWVTQGDFLLQPPGAASHVASNPPYVRWAKLPGPLATQYCEALPRRATRGDLAVAFLHRMQEWSQTDTRIVALVSDRWMFTQYGEAFVAACKAGGWSMDVIEERPEFPFRRKVGAYASIVRFERSGPSPSRIAFESRASAQSRHAELAHRFGTLLEAACTLRVGPALGAGRTFLLSSADAARIEPELVRPFIDKSDLAATRITRASKQVVVPYDRNGKMIDIDSWPRFGDWARRNEHTLRKRAKFAVSDCYWRTIDAVPSTWDAQPKLILPELCKTPVAVLDCTGSVPAHSLYALWSKEWPIEILQRVLNAGLLALTAAAEAPRLGNGWVRFYKRFIALTPLPRWSDLDRAERADLFAGGPAFDRRFAVLFGFEVGAPPLG